MSQAIQQHVHIYSLSDGLPERVTADDLRSSRFDISFEQAITDLALLPRMFVEPDGSFVWSRQDELQPWHIDGMIYDRSGHVVRVELKGTALRQAWEPLLSIFGWPEKPLIAHYVDQQRFALVTDFLSDAASLPANASSLQALPALEDRIPSNDNHSDIEN